jgi:hypothetical protein
LSQRQNDSLGDRRNEALVTAVTLDASMSHRRDPVNLVPHAKVLNELTDARCGRLLRYFGAGLTSIRLQQANQRV